ncbi:hypothetical protein ACSMXN_20825 [Jatrophihabitans sp. DSM 45814]
MNQPTPPWQPPAVIPPGAPKQPANKVQLSKKFLWIGGAVVLVVGLGVGAASAGSNKAKAAAPLPAVTQVSTTVSFQMVTATPTITKVIATHTVQVRITYTPPPLNKTSDGQYVVGTEIVPGLWHTDGSEGCYWERDNSLSGGIGAIVANDNIDGPTTIQIDPSDKAVKFSGGCDWARIG